MGPSEPGGLTLTEEQAYATAGVIANRDDRCPARRPCIGPQAGEDGAGAAYAAHDRPLRV